MVTLMQRRRDMMQMAPIPPAGPLYPVDDFSYSPSSASWEVQRPHITAATSANSRQLYFGSANHSTSHSTSWDAMFTLHVGDARTISVQNIAFENSTSGSNNFTIALYSTDGTQIANTGAIAFGSGSGTIPDFEYTSTQSEEAVINAIRIVVFRATTLNFNLYLHVNGLWYTI